MDFTLIHTDRFNGSCHGTGDYEFALPAVSCSSCGNVWASTDRVHDVDLTMSAKSMLTSVEGQSPLELTQFREVASYFHDEIASPVKLGPGSRFPPFRWDIADEELGSDVYFPIGAPPGAPIISDRLATSLVNAKIRGVSFAPTVVNDGDADRAFKQLIPDVILQPVELDTCSDCGFELNKNSIKKNAGIQRSRGVLAAGELPTFSVFAARNSYPGLIVDSTVLSLLNEFDLSSCRTKTLTVVEKL